MPPIPRVPSQHFPGMISDLVRPRFEFLSVCKSLNFDDAAGAWLDFDKAGHGKLRFRGSIFFSGKNKGVDR